MKNYTICLVILILFNGCAITKYHWKIRDGFTKSSQAEIGNDLAVCSEKAITDNQVNACLYQKGYVWDKDES